MSIDELHHNAFSVIVYEWIVCEFVVKIKIFFFLRFSGFSQSNHS